MKNFTFNSKALGKLLILPALVFIAITVDSCKKESGVGTASPSCTTTAPNTEKLNSSVSKALRDLVISGAGTNQQSGVGSGNNSYSNTAVVVSSYSTPAANVYAWSDPTTGTSFTLSESTGGAGGGLGQIAYNGKSFDYNYVLCIKASAKDPDWDGFLNGRDLRGVVAIDGQLTDADFILKNLAIFLVGTKGGDGKYDFIKWDSQSITSGDAIGELLDFSEVVNNNLASMAKAKVFITSNGSIEVTETSFTLSSNAKVTDVISGSEYDISGSISCE